MNERLKSMVARYEELTQQLASPDAMSDMELWQKMIKEHSSLSEIVGKNAEYEATQKELAELTEAVNSGDAELAGMAEEELPHVKEKAAALEKEIEELLAPKDPNDDKDVVLEIRAGTGGEEAALFAGDLLRMYGRYAERKGMSFEMVSLNETEIGGVKEAVVMIRGKGAYARLKFESGVHRVQRIPQTESGGRIHTSAATVAVLPEAEDVDIQINPEDLMIDTYRSGGAGGQNVNKVETAIRITHLPSGLVVQCQDERSQGRNREKAMKVLKTRLFDIAQAKQQQEYASERKNQVGSGDRSERIRTYNFPQGRISDHRIGFTVYALDQYLDGDLDDMVNALTEADRESKMNK